MANQPIFVPHIDYLMKILLLALFPAILFNTDRVNAQQPISGQMGKEFALADKDNKRIGKKAKKDRPSAYVLDNKAPEGVKRHVQRNLRHSTFLPELLYGRFTGGANAPFASSAGVALSYVLPKEKKHHAIEAFVGVGYLTDPSRFWNARSTGTLPSDISSMGPGWDISVGTSVSYIILNQRKIALTVGPEIMYHSVVLSDVSSFSSSTTYRSNFTSEMAGGIKARAYIGFGLTAQVGYIYGFRRSLTYETDLYSGVTATVPMSLSMIRMGVGYRL